MWRIEFICAELPLAAKDEGFRAIGEGTFQPRYMRSSVLKSHTSVYLQAMCYISKL
jgi:hypothetical protein